MTDPTDLLARQEVVLRCHGDRRPGMTELARDPKRGVPRVIHPDGQRRRRIDRRRPRGKAGNYRSIRVACLRPERPSSPHALIRGVPSKHRRQGQTTKRQHGQHNASARLPVCHSATSTSKMARPRICAR